MTVLVDERVFFNGVDDALTGREIRRRKCKSLQETRSKKKYIFRNSLKGRHI